MAGPALHCTAMTHEPAAHPADPAADLRRLRWRCRRGMRELDQLFERWLGQVYPAATDAERGVFLRLLDCEDDRLWRWFMGYEACPDAELADLIARIRALPA
jgi:antitoxin CptB